MISATAIFACSDIEATIAYYKDVLGFDSSWTWGEPPSFGCASKGGVSIMFCLQPALAANVKGHQHWIKVDDADELHELHVSNGASLVEDIRNTEWGTREYAVEDLNGYHLRFAGPPSSDAPPSNPFPAGVTIERRKPTKEEFSNIGGKVFGYKEPVPGLLDRTWSGIVAHSPEGEAIGMLRIMWDAPAWFSIWDVAVIPEWQAQRIGSTMMKEALAMIAEASPGAMVHLFTFKHGFYERLGFNLQSASLRQV